MLLYLLITLTSASTSVIGDLDYFYNYDIIQTFNDSFSFQCFYNIPYNKIYFIKKDDVFYGRYQVSIEIWDGENLIAAKINTNEISTKDYEETKRINKFILDSTATKLKKSISLNTKLLAKMLIRDLNSKNQGSTQFNFVLPNNFSRIRFYNNRTPVPQHVFSTDPGIDDTLGVTFEIYNDSIDNCSLWIVKTHEQQNLSKSERFIFQNKNYLLSEYYPIEKLNYDKNLEDYKFIFFYPLRQLPHLESGQYLFIMAGYSQNKRRAFEIKDSFTIGNSFFYSESEYLEMVNRLIYIASETDIKNLKQIVPAKRDSAWHDFWRQHDPNPTTTVNESQQEYFTRIDYCIKNFSKGDKSYKSDRARIYMKYDKPDLIETRPFEQYSYAYEIWYYYSIGKQFIFTDAHGFGEFILHQEKRI